MDPIGTWEAEISWLCWTCFFFGWIPIPKQLGGGGDLSLKLKNNRNSPYKPGILGASC